jgi:hypothetical protein
LAAFELLRPQRFGEIHQKRAGSGPEQGQRNSQEGMASEEDDGENPGQKNLKAQGHCGDEEKNKQVYFPLRYRLFIFPMLVQLEMNPSYRILQSSMGEINSNILNAPRINPLTRLVANFYYDKS